MATPQQNLDYVLSNPDLREHAEAMGLTQDEAAEFGAQHWERHGKHENRANTQTEVTREAGYTEEWKPRGGEQQFAESLEKFGGALEGVGTSFWGGIDPSMWVAREAIGEAQGDDWGLVDADLTGWRYAADQPYQAGIQRGLIDVDADVGQLILSGDLDEDWGKVEAGKFIQDRYEDDYIDRDFPENWVDDKGAWKGPTELGKYWNALSTAERDDLGILRSTMVRPGEGWKGPTQNVTPTRGPWSSGNLLDGTQGSGWKGGAGGPAGETDYLAYRPGSEAYWQSYLGPELTGSLMRMQQPAITPAALGYLPGEQRDPINWANFLGFDGKKDKQFQGHIPQGIWTNDPQGYLGLTEARGNMAGYQGAPWQFAAQPSPMIAQPAWTPYDISPQAAGQWTGLLGDWAAPALNTTNLLGVA